MSRFKQRLYSVYLNNSLLEGEYKKTPLRRFVFSIGLDWQKLDRKKYLNIAKTKRFKDWKKLDKIEKIATEANSKKTNESLDHETSKKYKHLDKFHIKKKAIETGFVNTGWSPHEHHIRTARKSNKFSKAKVRVGKLAYSNRKGYTTFVKAFPGKGRVGKTKELRNLKKRDQYSGSGVRKIEKLFSSFDCNVYKIITEDKSMSKVEMLLKKNREIKKKNLDNKEIKHTNTETGNKNTDTIEFNPNL